MLIIPHNVADRASSLALLSFIDIRRTIGIRIQRTLALTLFLGAGWGGLRSFDCAGAIWQMYVGFFYRFSCRVSVTFIAKRHTEGGGGASVRRSDVV